MSLRRTAVLALLILLTAAGAAQAKVFSPETFTLKNGLQVVVVTSHRAPVVTQMVWYKVGSADERSGFSGIAHFLEHLMFKGTPKHPAGEFSKLVAQNGGQENAFTSYDYTAFYQTIAKQHLEMVMKMEADRMTHLVLTDAVIEPERQVVREERRMRTENNPSAILNEQATEALFRNYPYRRPVIGYDHEIVAMTRQNIIDFYHRWYAPNNAILVVAGDITAKELRPLAEKYFGPIPAQPHIKRDRPAEPPQMTARRVTLNDARVRQPTWQRTYVAPSYRAAFMGETPDLAPALEVLTEILGGGGSSRLYRALVVDSKVAVSAGSHYEPDAVGPGQFLLFASPRPGVSMDDLEKAVDKEIARVIADGVTPEELSRAVTRMTASAIYARDSFTAGARVLGAALAQGRTIDDVENWPDRIAAVTPAQVQDAARKVFHLNHSVTALLLGAAKAGN